MSRFESAEGYQEADGVRFDRCGNRRYGEHDVQQRDIAKIVTLLAAKDCSDQNLCV